MRSSASALSFRACARLAFPMTSIIRLALATPLNRLFHCPFKKFSVPALFAVQVCRCISSHWPLSYQSLPRVGTIITSVVSSFRVM